MKNLTTQESNEISRHLHNFAVMPGWNATTSKNIAKQLLESEWLFCNGDIREFGVKHLGLGVYKVYTKRKQF